MSFHTASLASNFTSPEAIINLSKHNRSIHSAAVDGGRSVARLGRTRQDSRKMHRKLTSIRKISHWKFRNGAHTVT